jgi:hypothetical protein
MNGKKLIAAIIGLGVFAFTGSNTMAHGGGRGGGFGGSGFRGAGFGGARFSNGGFRGGFNGRGFSRRGFRDGGFRGDRFGHRRFDDVVFFGDFGDPFFYDTYPYYGYYPYGYGYNSYAQPIYRGNAGYSDSVTGQVQLRLARSGYYHGAIDGVSGNATRRAIRGYERAHNLPADGQIRGRLLTTMGLG